MLHFEVKKFVKIDMHYSRKLVNRFLVFSSLSDFPVL